MAKKVTKSDYQPIHIGSIDDAVAALEEMEEIEKEIAPKMARAVQLKKAATEFAVKKKIAAIQLEDGYYRQITRQTKVWDEERLREICKGLLAANGKPLWNFITKRRLDPEMLNKAVAKGYISEKKAGKAFSEKPQAPFLQKYVGEASDAEG